MEAQRTGFSTYRLVHRGQEIGYIDGRRIGFTGFATAGDAGAAAWASALELRWRRRRTSGPAAPRFEAEPLLIERRPDDFVLAACDIVAAIVQTPGEAHLGEVGRWGFEIESPTEDGPDLLIAAQARVMWRGLRTTGSHRLMDQFAPAATL